MMLEVVLGKHRRMVDRKRRVQDMEMDDDTLELVDTLVETGTSVVEDIL